MRSAVVGVAIAWACCWASCGLPAVVRAEDPAAAPAADKTVAADKPSGSAQAPASITNSLGMRFVEIRAADFQMGEADAAKLTALHPTSLQTPIEYVNDRPQIAVRLTKPYWMAAHEVTVGQFGKFVSATGYQTDAEKSGRGAYVLHPEAKNESLRFTPDPKASWKNPGFEQDDTHPVVCVSWHDSLAFCEWLSKTEKTAYRLPTEAEWECACRATTTTMYSCGDHPDLLYAFGNVGDASLEAKFPGTVKRQRADHLEPGDGDGFVFTAPVGRFKPNAFGLHDMHGNVWEWCHDRYFDRQYTTFYKELQDLRKAKQPVFVVDPQGPETTLIDKYGEWRSLRGGSWYVSPISCRCAARSFSESRDGFSYTGFRVVYDAP